jgi:hypothetical protein
MTAGLSHEMPGHGAGICSGPISGSTMHNAGSMPFRSGGGARTATRSWMICGENSTGYVSYHWSRSILSPHYPSHHPKPQQRPDRLRDSVARGRLVPMVAGQTLTHSHLHVIPRYRNESGNPRGGVRGVISGRKEY